MPKSLTSSCRKRRQLEMEIEYKRKLMIKHGVEYGFTHWSTIKESKELDELLNALEKEYVIK